NKRQLQLVKPRTLINVDVVDTDGVLLEPDLARSRSANVDAIPLQHLRAAGAVDANSVRHGRYSVLLGEVENPIQSDRRIFYQSLRRAGETTPHTPAMPAFYGLRARSSRGNNAAILGPAAPADGDRCACYMGPRRGGLLGAVWPGRGQDWGRMSRRFARVR